MSQPQSAAPRLAGVDDAPTVARLLDAFNREFATPTPGATTLAARLARLLARPEMFALLTGEPAVGLALLSLRPSVWYDGPTAVLDELYVSPDLRSRGIGTALLASSEAEAQRRGVQLLEIQVDGEDADARRFYERHGYANQEPGQTLPLMYYYRELRSQD